MTATSNPAGDPSTTKAPIAVALDAGDAATMAQWAADVAPVVSTVKIGLEVYLRDGAEGVRLAREAIDRAGAQCDLFLDLKLHDIPATVAGAARSIAVLQPDYLTVHASGGAAMIEAAAAAVPDTRVTAVTVLTSLSPDDLTTLGISSPGTDVVDVVCRWAQIAVAAGARALVCSPREVAAVRSVVSDDVVLITPGVRPAGSAAQDQARVATPEQALADGADLLVIGRPITGAPDPRAAAEQIAQMCRGAGRTPSNPA